MPCHAMPHSLPSPYALALPGRMLDGRATHVQTGSLGTPTHAAPELLREGRLASPADVYAFGVLGGLPWQRWAAVWLGAHVWGMLGL